MKKPVFYTELAYGSGLLLLAMGTALTVFGDFGISMVVAPAYILHLKLRELWPFFTFGMAEYVLQALIVGIMLLTFPKRKWTWLLSFVTAVLYALILDGSSVLLALLPQTLTLRIMLYLLGVAMCTAGIALLFRTYLPPAAYELLVKELARRKGWQVHRVKTVYDCASCILAAVLSFLLLGRLEGVGVGTVACALGYGQLIRLWGRLLERCWTFRDCLDLRTKFEESEERS